MILLVDNYDSFVYNLYQFIGEALANIRVYDLKNKDDLAKIYDEIKVIRNDEMTIDEVKSLCPDCIFLSPGPGKPSDAGISKEIVLEFLDKVPIFGVCLGHQSICEALGANIVHAKELMHGKTSDISLEDDKLFKNLESTVTVGRYHSLSVEENSIPDCLNVIAKADDGEVMAVKYDGADVYGLQFHPESILSPCGMKIIENFLNIVEN